MGKGNCQPYCTIRWVKGGSEEQDDAPMTEEQTLKRLREHKEAQACSGVTQPDDENPKSGSDDSSDESSSSSAADSVSSGSVARKTQPKLTTPRKPTSGLQQLGNASSTKEKKVASLVPAATLDVLQKMRAGTLAIEEVLKKYVSGMYDATRGRHLHGLYREWGGLIKEAQKCIKVDGTSDEKRGLHIVLQQLEAVMALMKVVVKTSATYLETAACYDTLKHAGGQASDGCRKVLLERNVDDKLSNGDVPAVISLMSKKAGAHGVYELMTGAKVPEALVMVATKLVVSVVKVKLDCSPEVAQQECADLTVRFKHALGFPQFPEGLRTQLDTMFTAMNPAVATDASCIGQAAVYASGFPRQDGRNKPESPFAAFAVSKVGKIAIKNLASRAEKVAQESSNSKDFKGVDARVLALKCSSAKWTIRMLKDDLMPQMRQLKTCCKGGDPDEVQCVVDVAKIMFCNVGGELVYDIMQAAPFLCQPKSLFARLLRDPALFKEKVVELDLLADLWNETFADIVPFCYNAGHLPATETVAERSVQCIDQFLRYVALAQYVASQNLAIEMPAATLRSLGSSLLQLWEPSVLDAIDTFVGGLTTWVAESCDIPQLSLEWTRGDGGDREL